MLNNTYVYTNLRKHEIIRHRAWAERGPALPVWLLAWRARGGVVVAAGGLAWWERACLLLFGCEVVDLL